MSYLNMMSPTTITVPLSNDLGVGKISRTDIERNPFSEFNDLRNVFVDSHMISDLNLTTEHIDKIEIQLKEKMDLSPLKDIDFKQEVEEFSKDSIKTQNGDLAFTQANAKSSKVEELLK